MIKIQVSSLPMPACRYVGEISSPAILAAKRSAGVTPEMNVRECITHIYANKAYHFGFEIRGRHHHKSKKGISGPTKRIYVLQTFLKNKENS